MQNNRLKPELDPRVLANELSGKLLIGGALVPARRGGTHVEELGRLVALETGKALRTESRIEASILADA